MNSWENGGGWRSWDTGEWVVDTKKKPMNMTEEEWTDYGKGKGWRQYDESKWVDQQAYVYPAVGEYSVTARWSSSSNKKWRPRDPTDENIEKANSMPPMYAEEESRTSTPNTKDTHMDPIEDKNKLKTAKDEETQEEEERGESGKRRAGRSIC